MPARQHPQHCAVAYPLQENKCFQEKSQVRLPVNSGGETNP